MIKWLEIHLHAIFVPLSICSPFPKFHSAGWSLIYLVINSEFVWGCQTWKPWQKWTVGGLRLVSGGCRLEPSLWGAQGTQVLSGAKHQQSLRLCSARQSQWMITAILVTQPWFPAKSVFFVEVFSPVNCNPQFENWIGLCLPLSLLDSPKMLSQRSKKCFRN